MARTTKKKTTKKTTKKAPLRTPKVTLDSVADGQIKLGKRVKDLETDLHEAMGIVKKLKERVEDLEEVVAAHADLHERLSKLEDTMFKDEDGIVARMDDIEGFLLEAGDEAAQ